MMWLDEINEFDKTYNNIIENLENELEHIEDYFDKPKTIKKALTEIFTRLNKSPNYTFRRVITSKSLSAYARAIVIKKIAEGKIKIYGKTRRGLVYIKS